MSGRVIQSAGSVLLAILLLTCFASLAAGQSFPTTSNGHVTWDVRPTWGVVEELQVGQLLSGGPDEFGAISALTVDTEGRIYVADFLAAEVRVFDASGRHLRTLGRRGEGPGEFGRIRGVAVFESGDVWVLDVEPARVSVFATDGSLRTSFSRTVRGSLIPWPGRAMGGDRLLDWGLDRSRREGGYGADVALLPTLVDADGSIHPQPPIRVSLARNTAGMPKVLNRSTVQAVDRHGTIWFAKTDEYRVFARTLKGDTLRSFALASDPLPVDIDSVRAAYAAGGRAIRPDDVFPFHRVLTRLIVDDAGRVFTVPQGRGIAAGAVLDAFDQTGAFLGRIALPTAIHTRVQPVIMNNRLYAVVRDAFDVQYVVRWRLDVR